MNRELKFRAWDLGSADRMYSWEEIKKQFSEHVEHEQVVVMQYTGLKDKNGTEIYEGDIVDYGYRMGVVVWYDHGWHLAELSTKCIEPQYAGKPPYQVYLDGEHCVEMDRVIPFPPFSNPSIIGNIYENPELLTSNTQS